MITARRWSDVLSLCPKPAIPRPCVTEKRRWGILTSKEYRLRSVETKSSSEPPRRPKFRYANPPGITLTIAADRNATEQNCATSGAVKTKRVVGNGACSRNSRLVGAIAVKFLERSG